MTCSAYYGETSGLSTIELANDVMSLTLLPQKGADIYALRYLPRDVDVLWKSPWGLHPPGPALTFPSSFEAWVEWWGGGWQVLFPSGGGPSDYKGATLHFHGEASILPWTCDSLTADDSGASASLSVRLVRSPFRLSRVVSLSAGSPVLTIRETVVNEAGEDMDFMWVHHPTFGAPFLSGACRLDCGAALLTADDDAGGPYSPLEPGEAVDWPGQFRRVPGSSEKRSLLGYLSGFPDTEPGWFALTNTELDMGFGLVWPTSTFPYAWLWQELHGSTGYPWYGNTYALAVEPSTSVPNAGLSAVIERTGTHHTLGPGGTAEMEIRGVFYEGVTGVSAISADGTVTPA